MQFYFERVAFCFPIFVARHSHLHSPSHRQYTIKDEFPVRTRLPSTQPTRRIKQQHRNFQSLHTSSRVCSELCQISVSDSEMSFTQKATTTAIALEVHLRSGSSNSYYYCQYFLFMHWECKIKIISAINQFHLHLE